MARIFIAELAMCSGYAGQKCKHRQGSMRDDVAHAILRRRRRRKRPLLIPRRRKRTTIAGIVVCTRYALGVFVCVYYITNVCFVCECKRERERA